MAKLLRADNKETLLSDLKIANTFLSRGIGLIGKSDLLPSQGMWFDRGNSIHTFFMKFSIDCVFLDASMKVKKVIKDVKPGRVTLPVWGAISVLELKAGVADRLQIKEGDVLYVGA